MLYLVLVTCDGFSLISQAVPATLELLGNTAMPPPRPSY